MSSYVCFSFFLANPFIYLFYLYLSAYLYICLSIYGLYLYLSISLSLCLPVYLSIYLSNYLSMSISIYSTFISRFYLSIHLSIHPRSFYLSVHLSEYPYPSINLHSKIQWTDGRTGWILLLVTPSGVFFRCEEDDKRTQYKNASEKLPNFVAGHVADGFHYRKFHGTKTSKPEEDRQLICPSLDMMLFWIFSRC